MPKEPRKATPPNIELAVFDKSRRRCTLCFWLEGDLAEKNGQIAHLDDNPANSAEDNLAFMCINHHSLYDSRTRQHKNYTIQEVKQARNRLYEAIARGDHFTKAAPQPVRGLEADRRTLERIITQMTTGNVINIIREFDFGNSFDTLVLDVIGEFASQNDPNHEFIELDLEQRRKSLLTACKMFLADAGRFTWALNNSNVRRVPSEWHETNPSHYESVVNGLNDKASDIFRIYEDLIRTARRKLEA